MKMSPLFKLLAGFVVGSLLAGCKIDLIVSSGGDVTSASGTRNCARGTLCEFNITDYSFNESFTAVAKPGFVFSKWSAGDGYLCANSTNPTCTIANAVIPPGNAAIDGVIASEQIFYAMPIFTFVGIDTDSDGVKDHLDADDDNDGVLDVDDQCPLAGPNASGFGCPQYFQDSAIIDGKEWAQPSKFLGLSWNDVNAVCPAGVCAGTLNGYDMTGWKWASLEEMNALFHHFNETYPLGLLPWSISVPGTFSQGHILEIFQPTYSVHVAPPLIPVNIISDLRGIVATVSNEPTNGRCAGAHVGTVDVVSNNTQSTEYETKSDACDPSLSSGYIPSSLFQLTTYGIPESALSVPHGAWLYKVL